MVLVIPHFQETPIYQPHITYPGSAGTPLPYRRSKSPACGMVRHGVRMPIVIVVDHGGVPVRSEVDVTPITVGLGPFVKGDYKPTKLRGHHLVGIFLGYGTKYMARNMVLTYLHFRILIF